MRKLEAAILLSGLMVLSAVCAGMSCDTASVCETEESTNELCSGVTATLIDSVIDESESLVNVVPNEKIIVTASMDGATVEEDEIDISEETRIRRREELARVAEEKAKREAEEKAKKEAEEKAKKEAEERAGKFLKVEATAYCVGTVTADGSGVKRWFTLAGKRAWLGKACRLYRCKEDGSVGECLGYFEFHDTGKDYRLKNGTAIDIYIGSYSECVNWGRRNVYIEWL